MAAYDLLDVQRCQGTPFQRATCSHRESLELGDLGLHPIPEIIQGFVHDKATLEPMECVKIDQRMLGLVDSVNGLPRMKPTGILTASGEVKRRLHAAQCDGNHYHQQLDTKARCVNAQQWPRNMCDQILSGLLAELDHILTIVAFPAEAEQGLECSEKTYLDGIVTDEDFAAVSASDFAEKKNKKSGRLSTKKEKSHHFRNQLGDHYTDDSNNGDNYHTTHVWLFGDGTT